MIIVANSTGAALVAVHDDAQQAAILALAAAAAGPYAGLRVYAYAGVLGPNDSLPASGLTWLNGPVSLLAYANAASTNAESAGTNWTTTVQAADGTSSSVTWPVKTTPEAQRMALGEVQAIDLGERKDGELWGFADGVPRALTNDQMKALAIQIRSHVKASHTAYMQVMAGIAASPPTITTTDQIDQAFAAVT